MGKPIGNWLEKKYGIMSCNRRRRGHERTNITQIKICPRCGKVYHEPPALSRIDNQTLICPDCGTREALESIDVDRQEQEEILAIIHRQRREIND